MDFVSFVIFLTKIFLVLIFSLYLYFKWAFTYWKSKNIPYIDPSFPLGNIDLSFYGEYGQRIKEFYKKLKDMKVDYGGIYILTQPVFIPVEPEIIKHILLSDYDHFDDRGFYINEMKEPLSNHLFALSGEKWKILRTKMTPAFSTNKIKAMCQIMYSCGEGLERLIDDIVNSNNSFDIYNISARYTIDVISSSTFGVDCNSLTNPETEIYVAMIKFFELNFFSTVKILLALSCPRVLEFFNMKVLPEEFTNFFVNFIRKNVEYREKNNIIRPDLINTLIQMKNHQFANEEDGMKYTITFEELMAQCFVFFLAGYESSSSSMTYCMFELSQNQDIQDKVRDEISTVLNKHAGKLCYEAIMDMKYLNNVVSETLRKYPPIVVLNRRCVKEYKIPGRDDIIEKGTHLVISTLGLHMDPEYFPDPEKFDPGRFTEEEKLKRPAYCYVPFGGGPKNCIGSRFGSIQTKVGIIHMLRKYKFTLDPKTILPLKYKTSTLVLKNYDKIWLRASRLE